MMDCPAQWKRNGYVSNIDDKVDTNEFSSLALWASAAPLPIL